MDPRKKRRLANALGSAIQNYKFQKIPIQIRTKICKQSVYKSTFWNDERLGTNYSWVILYIVFDYQTYRLYRMNAQLQYH